MSALTMVKDIKLLSMRQKPGLQPAVNTLFTKLPLLPLRANIRLFAPVAETGNQHFSKKSFISFFFFLNNKKLLTALFFNGYSSLVFLSIANKLLFMHQQDDV